MSGPPDWKRAPEFGDPYPGYAWLRENDPVHWSESLRVSVITRYEDVREVFDRPTRFSSDRFRKVGAQYASQREAVVACWARVGRVLGDWMVFRDPPDHTRLRALFQKSFTTRQLERTRPQIEKMIGQLLDQMAKRADCASYATAPFPCHDDTLVVVTGDHGEGFMEHGTKLHSMDIYDETVRVPLIIRWPGRIAAGTGSSAPVQVVDIAPTVLGLLGKSDPSARLEGRSLAPFLTGATPLDPGQPVFLYRRHFDEMEIDGIALSGEQYGVRVGDLKLIQHTTGRRELYDPRRDPYEQRDLAEESPEDVARLQRVLDSWKQEHVSPKTTPAMSDGVRKALEALGYGE